MAKYSTYKWRTVTWGRFALHCRSSACGEAGMDGASGADGKSCG